MRALRLHGQHDIRLDHIPIPTCGPGEVRLKPAVVGICGTDVHEWSRGPTLVPTSPHPLTGGQMPITLGHEICGVVDEVGEGVLDVVPGQRVAVQPIVADGTCRACLQGRINVCRQQGFVGLSKDGGLAEYLVVARRNVAILPDHVPLEIGALIEPLAVGWHAIRLSGIPLANSSILVLGAGPIGLAVIQALALHRPRQIIVSEPSAHKRDLALRLGASHVLDPLQKPDIVLATRSIVGEDGEGVHAAFDCVGKQVTLDQAVAATGTGGSVVNIAIWGGRASIEPNAFALAEKRFMGSSVYTEQDFHEVVEALATGKINPVDMITARVSLDSVVSDGIKGCLIEGSGTHVKVLVDMSRR